MRIGGAVGQDAVDVDIGVLRAAILLSVHKVGLPVEVGRGLEVEIAEPLVDRELEVLEPRRQQRRVGRQRELVIGHAKERTGDRVVEAARRDAHRVAEGGAGGVEARGTGHGTVGVSGDWSRRRLAARAGHGFALEIHDGIEAAVGIPNVVVGAAPVDARGRGGGERGGRGPAQRRRSVVGESAVPSRKPIVQGRHPGLLLDLEVLALEPDLGVTPRPESGGGEHALAPVEVLLAPAVAVSPHPGGPDRGALADGLVDVKRRPVGAPRTGTELHRLERAVGASALGGGGAGAAERAVAEEDRIGAAPEIDPLDIEGVVVPVLRKEIALLRAGADAAGLIVRGEREERGVAVVRNAVRARRPFRRALQICEIQRVDEFARDDRIGCGSIPQVGGQSTAGERAGGGETFVAIRADGEGRELDRLSGLRRSGRGRSGRHGLRRRGNGREQDDRDRRAERTEVAGPGEPGRGFHGVGVGQGQCSADDQRPRSRRGRPRARAKAQAETRFRPFGLGRSPRKF